MKYSLFQFGLLVIVSIYYLAHPTNATLWATGFISGIFVATFINDLNRRGLL